MTAITIPYTKDSTFKTMLQLALLNSDEVQTVYDDLGIPNARYISTAGHGYLVSIVDPRLITNAISTLYDAVREELQSNGNINMLKGIMIAEEDCDYPLLMLLLHVIYHGAIAPLSTEEIDRYVAGASAYRDIKFLQTVYRLGEILKS